MTDNARKGPGPALLPGIEGFYVLTGNGRLGRYQSDGSFVDEPTLSARLATQIETLLKRYRDGDAAAVSVGLVIRHTPDRPWHCASLVFSDAALREVYHAGEDPDAPLTSFQERNRVKSVYRGMELILDTRKASRPDSPRYCPVLFAPEVEHTVLAQRFSVEDIDAVNALEVLDLMAALAPGDPPHPALTRMVVEMSQSKIAPELRSAPDLMLVETPGSTPETQWNEPSPFDSPWQDLPDQRLASFSDGDPVTYWLLASFSPFNELNDVQRQFVARGHRVIKKPAGTTLIERGSTEDITFYLIEGTLELEAFDGRTMQIEGGTRRAHLPVSQLRPHAYTVRTLTTATLFCVSQDMVRELNRISTTYRSRPEIEVTEGELPDAAPSGSVAYEPGSTP
ncbi:MAG TPA: cyclic nucleotide-binding domain-containing protein [Arenicellales bacterium]|nr:cyclic nucleotide-binding domain-containing protein [Arenicellales bacterium]